MTDSTTFDVIIIGGSYAGLSAAMSLGRSLKQTLIIDSGKPCNRQTPHSHNFLTQDGNTPAEISAIARKQVEQYETVQFYNGLAISGKQSSDTFEIETKAGDFFSASKLIFATGIKDNLPDIPGIAECWGITVIHCPYCHGYEFKGQETGILANGDPAFHAASLVNNLTGQLTIFTNGPAEFKDGQLSKLDKNSISIFESEITEIVHENGQIQHVAFKDGTKKELDALYAAIPFTQHCDIPVSLGCELTEHGYIKTDDFQKTTVQGIFACGDNCSMMRSVANAVATGNFTGAMANMELTKERF